MTSIQFDDSEIRAIGADLRKAGERLSQDVRPVMHRCASNIKRQLRAEMGASRHFRGAARSIDYSMRSGMGPGGGQIEAEIGPRKGAPGSLANIAYFGTSRGGGTVPDPDGALQAEVPGFLKALGDIAEGTL
ncbi:hypothetical protein [Isoptericola sp. QY 916]|uniref:hypothetical protein n=1 Tax=Isoptericola sp. QY 916 TaxID=2782570 RepID=UPI003D2FD500|nr:hypothetical protein [Isoptericola sp. QY 916]